MSSSSTASKRWDHPRRCGENRADAASTATLEGSPPQVRGKQIKAGGVGGTDRITPAGAGKTRRCCAHRPKFQDHPRRCGENRNVIEFETCLPGSPPQVRGKLIHIPPSSQGKRITPAGAGKTAQPWVGIGMAGDHPRRCGENMILVVGMHIGSGSPPQVRGKLEYRVEGETNLRITPAGAGKTRPSERR